MVLQVGQLAMETLLSMTSKRAGEWFKEELRQLGGLDHILKTVCDCCSQVSGSIEEWTDLLLDKLRKIERCLRVLENVIEMFLHVTFLKEKFVFMRFLLFVDVL